MRIWISNNYTVSAIAIRDLGLRDAKDREIFNAARHEKAVVMTKEAISCCCLISWDHHLK